MTAREAPTLRRSRSWGTVVHKALPTVVVLAVLIGVWEYGSRTVAGGGLILPSPLAVVRALGTDAWMIMPALANTLESSAWGLLWGALIGIASAIVAASVKPIRALVTRQFTLLFCLPLAAIAPLIILMSSSPGPEIIMGALSAVFPIYNALLQGLVAERRAWQDLVAVFGGGKVRYFFAIQLPAATGTFFTAARIGVPAAILGVTLAEYFTGAQGVGALMISSVARLESARAYALGIVITAVVSASYLVVGLVARLFPWIYEVPNE